MEEEARNGERMKRRFNELIWESCPGNWTAAHMEMVANKLLNVWLESVRGWDKDQPIDKSD